jgi:hypothetical protein
MFDLGFVPEPHLAALIEKLGVRVLQEAVIDPLSHYEKDQEMVAVTPDDRIAMTRNLSLTFFPGMRPLEAVQPAPGINVLPLFSSSRDSYTRPVEPAGVREVGDAQPHMASTRPSEPGPRLLAVAAEGQLPGASSNAPRMRAVIVGDGDFASNSFLPFASNGDFAMAMMRWLVREERSTPVATRIPVPPMILLSGTQQSMMFLFVEVLLPLAVIALGGIVWWRRR